MKMIILFVMAFLIVVGSAQHVFELDRLATYGVAGGLSFLFLMAYWSLPRHNSRYQKSETDRTRVIGTGETIIVPIQSLSEQDN